MRNAVNSTSWTLTVIFVGGLVYSWGWIIVNVPELFNVGVVYEFMTVFSIILAVYLISINKPVFGFPPLHMFPETTIVGMLLGLLSLLMAGAISQLPLFQASLYQKLPPLIAFFFAFLISCTEEACFRGTMLPVLYYHGGAVQAILFDSILFSLLHWTVYQVSPASFLVSFIFSVIASILSLYYKTGYVGMAAHLTHNLAALYSLIGWPL